MSLSREVAGEIAQKYSQGQVCVIYPFGVPIVTLDDTKDVFGMFLTISKKKEIYLRLINYQSHELKHSFRLKDHENILLRGQIIFLYFGEHTIHFDDIYPVQKYHDTTTKILKKVYRSPPKKYPKKYVIEEEDEERRNVPTDIYLPVNSEVSILRQAGPNTYFVRSDADEGECGFITSHFLGDKKVDLDVNGYQSIIVDEQKKVLRRLVAIQSYDAQRGDEISIHINDKIRVLELTEENWWKGEINGKVGLFPSTFCENIEEETEGEDKYQLNNLSDTVILSNPPKPTNKPPLPPSKPPTSVPTSKPVLSPNSKNFKRPPKPKHLPPPVPMIEDPSLLSELENRLNERKHFPAAPLIQLKEQSEETLNLAEADENAIHVKENRSKQHVSKIEGPNLLSELENRLNERKNFPAAPLIQLEEQSEETLNLAEADENAIIGTTGIHVKEVVEQYEFLITMLQEGESPSLLKGQDVGDIKRSSLQVMKTDEKQRMITNIDNQVLMLENLRKTLKENYNKMKQELNLNLNMPISPSKHNDRRSLRISDRFKKIVGRYEIFIHKQKKKSAFELEIERKKKLKVVEEIEDELEYVNEMINVFRHQRLQIKSSISN